METNERTNGQTDGRTPPLLELTPQGGQLKTYMKKKVYIKIHRQIFLSFPVSGMKKSVVRAGNTCGQPKINSQMKNLTVDIGDTAR